MSFWISDALAQAQGAPAPQAGWESLIFPIGLVLIFYFFLMICYYHNNPLLILFRF